MHRDDDSTSAGRDDSWDRERFDELALLHLSGDLESGDRAELDALLSGFPEAASRLRELAEDEARLASVSGGSFSVPSFSDESADASTKSATISTIAPERRVRARAIWAAAAVLFVSSGLWFFSPWFLGPGSSTEQAFAYSFSGAELQIVPTTGEPQAAKSGELSRATRYLARGGTISVGDTRVRILAPTVFSIPETETETGIVVDLFSGGVSAVSTAADGLRVRTPRGTVRDLGTEFELRLSHDLKESSMIQRIRMGALPVFVLATVLSGKIAWEPKAADAEKGGPTRVLTASDGKVALSADGALGAISEPSGVVFVKRALDRRWRRARDGMRVRIGDWLKASVRGPNAARIKLDDGAEIVFGPGTVFQVRSIESLQVASGSLEVTPKEGTSVELSGPGGAKLQLSSKGVVRASTEGLESIAKPTWLAGYESNGERESLGSLSATIDGRAVPLSIDRHRVTVDIRDQIARTIIDQTFVNHTKDVLEGEFYFPLPAGASISGFAMWVGGEMVEADIVERERARFIYEQIRSEKRDPGLLEWSGGNVFKASVYPIPAQGTKRIRLTYTQVLEKEQDAYRYRYPLRSEMLRKKPLRELDIRVLIASAEGVASVDCPSHVAGVQTSENGAQVNFHAEAYAPERDFEVVVRTNAGAGVQVVSHQRAEDAYFMALLSVDDLIENAVPPVQLERTDGPLDLIVVADTSASVDDRSLREAREMIFSLLSALDEKDRFRLLAFDADAQWIVRDARAATTENIADALTKLERRGGMGWSNYDVAFSSLSAVATDSSEVVYVGDGQVSQGEADVAAEAKVIRSHYRRGRYHSISVGNAYETSTLRAIVSCGDGVLLHAADAASHVADLLLEQMTSPSIRDVKLDWSGVRVAAVYPREMRPFVPGEQRVVVGRYLSGVSEAQLTVSFSAGESKHSVTVPVAFAKPGEGNSYLPRLWARRHLDELLSQGRSPELVEQIVSLSEDFQIITPYTSFLVLESEADRERFGVKKRVRMRDGEIFFADGARDAQFELRRDQMREARLWRQALRQRVLERYRLLGMDPIPQGRWLRGRGIGRGQFVGKSEAPGAEFEETTEDGEDGIQELHKGMRLASFSDMNSDGGVPAPVLEGLIADGLKMEFGNDRFEQGFEPVARRRVVGSSFPPGLGVPIPRPGLWNLFPSFRRTSNSSSPAWPDEVLALTKKLDRRGSLPNSDVRMRLIAREFDVDARGREVPAERSDSLLSKGSWLQISQNGYQQPPHLKWWVDEKTGVINLSRGLGRVRAQKPRDDISFDAPFDEYFERLQERFRTYAAELRRDEKGTWIEFSRPGSTTRYEFLIDEARSVVLEVVQRSRFRVTRTRFSNFVEVDRVHWPALMERLDGSGRVSRRMRMTYEALDEAKFAQAVTSSLSVASRAILLDEEGQLSEAKERAQAGRGSFTDHWTLLRYYAQTQRWGRAEGHFRALEEVSTGRAG
ncbi:MAG: VIT domain-containing protein, partial [Planctomycetota bacterium]